MSFTAVKDINLKILSELNDRDLLNVCSTDKKAYNQICTDPHFWRNRLVQKYGEMAVKHKPEGRSWKNHYMQLIIDLEKYRDNPISFLDIILWDPHGIGESFYETSPDDIESLLKAPEWVMNNLYLLDLGKELIIWLENGFDENENLLFEKKILSHPTPAEVLKLVSNKLLQQYELKNIVYIKGLLEFTDEDGTPTEGYNAAIITP
jgi:hypothetical protein